MPRTKPLVRHGPYERDILEKIGICRTVLRMKDYQIASAIGMPKSTFSVKLKSPGTFTVSEFDAIAKLYERAKA